MLGAIWKNRHVGCRQDSTTRALHHPFHMLNEFGTAVWVTMDGLASISTHPYKPTSEVLSFGFC